jgi:hypothetical protein
MDRVVSSVIRSDVSLRGVAGRFHTPYSILKDRVNCTKTQNALRKDIIRKPGGHLTVFIAGEGKDLTVRIKI